MLVLLQFSTILILFSPYTVPSEEHFHLLSTMVFIAICILTADHSLKYISSPLFKTHALSWLLDSLFKFHQVFNIYQTALGRIHLLSVPNPDSPISVIIQPSTELLKQ